MKIVFYFDKETIPSHMYEALQIFAISHGMPELVNSFPPEIIEKYHPGSNDAIIRVTTDDGKVTDYPVTAALAKESSAKADILSMRDTSFTSDENHIKRYIYEIMAGIYGYKAPWGCHTGVRPAKQVNNLKKAGISNEEIVKHFCGFFMTEEKKARLAIEVAANQSMFLEDQIKNPDNFGFYVGVPFCPSKCIYCTFGSTDIAHFKKQTDQYVDVLEREIAATWEMVKERGTLESVYIGGGTPTSISAKQLDRVLTALDPLTTLPSVREFALEAGRPDSITRDKLLTAKSHGVTRISVNPQTMNQKTLDLIGRRHTVEDTINAFELARELGFDNINMDIIAGLPGENVDDFRKTLEYIEKMAPESLTVHTLSIKHAADLRQNEMQKGMLECDIVGTMVSEAYDTAKALGMHPFYMYKQKNMVGGHENVCYCVPGRESPYNVHIMEEDQSIFACGPGAVTKVVRPVCAENENADSDRKNIERCFNMKGVPDYLSRLDIIMERKAALLGK